mgnify:FL=1
MNWKKFRQVGLDSNIFSYQFHQHPVFGPISKQIFDLLSTDKLKAVTSFITLTEILSVKASPAKIKELEKLFLDTPNLNTFEVNQEIAVNAAKIRRKYGFRLPDAIQLATAKLNKAKAFISNDERLKRFKELNVILINEAYKLDS